MACSKSPVISAIAMINRFPNEWPFRLPSLKRCWKRVVIRGSTSASAVMHCRKSPGGRMRYSARSRPELPPSSATVTIAVRLPVYFLSPRSRVESPVPRSEEHTSELQSQSNLVCRLLLEKKKKQSLDRFAASHIHPTVVCAVLSRGTYPT